MFAEAQWIRRAVGLGAVGVVTHAPARSKFVTT
jgi:hypothetical protein